MREQTCVPDRPENKKIVKTNDNELRGCSGECDYCEQANKCEQSEYFEN